MIDIEIESNGERLLMSDNNRMRVTFQSSDLREAGTSLSSFSTSAKLPLTNENITKLGFKTVQSIKPTETAIIKARILSGDNELDKGFIRIDNVNQSEKEIGVTFFGRNADWFSQLKGKEIRDIDLSIYDHVNSSANIDISRTEGYVYLPVDYGYLAGKSSATIELNEIFPALFVRDIIKHIFKDIGYKVSGTLFDRPELDRMLIPFSGETPVHSNEWIRDRTDTKICTNGEFLDSNGSFGIEASLTPTIIPFDRILQKTSESTFNHTTPYYVVNEPMDLIINLNVVIVCPFNPFTTNNNQCVIKLYKNGVSVGEWANRKIINGTVSFVNLIVGDTFYVTYNTTLGTGAGRVYINMYNAFSDSKSITFTIGGRRLSYEVYTGSTSKFEFLAQKRLALGSKYQMSWFLPKLKQSELIEYVFFKFNVLVSFDKTTNSVVIDTINDLNILDSDDWSDKLDLSSPIERNYFDFLNNYARKNACKYDSDSDNIGCEQYLSEYAIGYGDGSIDINNQYLDTEKEYYTAPFLPCISTKVFTGIANLQMYMPSLYQKDNASAYILYYCPNISVSDMTGGVISSVTIAGVSKTHIPYAYFVTPINFINDPLINQNLCFDNPIDKKYDGVGVLDKNYKKIEDVLNNSETISAYMFLSALEISTIMYNRLRYIEALGGYYYLNKIGQYDASGDSTECELIKWN